MNKPFLKFERGRKKILLEPKLEQLPGIASLHKEESASGREYLVGGYLSSLHKELTNRHDKGHSRKVTDFILGC